MKSDVSLAVELGRPRRQWRERDVTWNLEFVRAPGGLVKDELSWGSRVAFDLAEMKLCVAASSAGTKSDIPLRSCISAWVVSAVIDHKTVVQASTRHDWGARLNLADSHGSDVAMR